MSVQASGARTGTAATAAALAVTLGLAAAAWVVAVRQMSGMDMGVATRLGSFAFFAAVWVTMMAAMMLPGAVPAVVRRVQASGRLRGVPLFLGSYLAVWALAGVAVYALYRPHGVVVAGAVVIAAGAYELTPLKQHFRRRCQESRRLRARLRAVLPRVQHRADGDAGRAERHERHLDGGDHRPGPRPEAPAREAPPSMCRWRWPSPGWES